MSLFYLIGQTINMSSNKKDLKAYVRYDGTGRVIPGSLILNRFKPEVGNWTEIDSSLCCNPPSTSCYKITFDVDNEKSIEITWTNSIGEDSHIIPVGQGVGYELVICALPDSIVIKNAEIGDYVISAALGNCSGETCAPCRCYVIEYEGIELLKYTQCDGVIVYPDTKVANTLIVCAQQGSIDYIVGPVIGAFINVTGGTNPCVDDGDCV
jgi:hypothetical protein